MRKSKINPLLSKNFSNVRDRMFISSISDGLREFYDPVGMNAYELLTDVNLAINYSLKAKYFFPVFVYHESNSYDQEVFLADVICFEAWSKDLKYFVDFPEGNEVCHARRIFKRDDRSDYGCVFAFPLKGSINFKRYRKSATKLAKCIKASPNFQSLDYDYPFPMADNRNSIRILDTLNQDGFLIDAKKVGSGDYFSDFYELKRKPFVSDVDYLANVCAFSYFAYGDLHCGALGREQAKLAQILRGMGWSDKAIENLFVWRSGRSIADVKIFMQTVPKGKFVTCGLLCDEFGDCDAACEFRIKANAQCPQKVIDWEKLDFLRSLGVAK